MVECVSQGDRECHILILLLDIIDWEEDFPPPLVEEYTQSFMFMPVYNYVENMEEIKSMLSEMGLKNIQQTRRG